MEAFKSSMSVFVRKPRRCPSCGGKRVSNIFYGFPAMDETLRLAIEEGKISLGGCCQEVGAPRWKCVDCDLELFKAG